MVLFLIDKKPKTKRSALQRSQDTTQRAFAPRKGQNKFISVMLLWCLCLCFLEAKN